MLGSLALVVGLALPTIGSGVAGVGVEPAAAADSLSFAPVTAFTVGRDPYSVALGDVNGDGKPDLVTANMSSNSVSVLLGTGTGSFGGRADFEVGSGPISVALGDVNGDGKGLPRESVTSDLWCREVPLEGCSPCPSPIPASSVRT